MKKGRSSRTPLISGDGPLAAVPPVAAFAVVIALFTVAVVVRGVLGAVLLGLLALGVGVLLAATWHAHSPAARAGRVVLLAVLVAVAVSVLIAT
jgi:hypothetical protein